MGKKGYKMYTNEDINLIKDILRNTIMDCTPKEFPELYRRGYHDGVFAALQVVCNIDLIVKSKSNE